MNKTNKLPRSLFSFGSPEYVFAGYAIGFYLLFRLFK